MQAIRGVQHGWQRTDADINSVHDHPVMTVTSAQRTYRDSILMRTLEFTRRSEYQLLGTDAHMQGGGMHFNAVLSLRHVPSLLPRLHFERSCVGTESTCMGHVQKP